MTGSSHPDADNRPPDEGLTPAHVAIIMDGNGRWAQARGLPRTAGHRQGVEAVRRTMEAARDLGITHLTLFGFSTENWQRPPQEVADLMGLIRFYLRSHIADLHKNEVRFRVIGDRARLDPDIVALIEQAERLTADHQRNVLTIAIGYGARQDIVQAARLLARKAVEEGLDPADIDIGDLGAALSTHFLPPVDLLIRTSGEKRLSNFLLFEAAYAELVFIDTRWPDFDAEHLARALGEYGRRERRYGAVAGG